MDEATSLPEWLGAEQRTDWRAASQGMTRQGRTEPWVAAFHWIGFSRPDAFARPETAWTETPEARRAAFRHAPEKYAPGHSSALSMRTPPHRASRKRSICSRYVKGGRRARNKYCMDGASESHQAEGAGMGRGQSPAASAARQPGSVVCMCGSVQWPCVLVQSCVCRDGSSERRRRCPGHARLGHKDIAAIHIAGKHGWLGVSLIRFAVRGAKGLGTRPRRVLSSTLGTG